MDQTNTGGAANSLTLTQKGGIHHRGNTIVKAYQSGTGNTGTVKQDGYLNYLQVLSQTGSGNDAYVSLRGLRNGSDGVATSYSNLGGGVFSASAASAVGVVQARVTQSGTGNDLSYSTTGNDNMYGFSQTGAGFNSINGTSSGDGNQVAVSQSGDGNVTDFTQTDGGNDLGVAIIGDDNGVGGFRGASDINLNNGQVIQRGGTNIASISIGVGGASRDNNYAAKQTNGGNSLTLTIDGGDTNNVAVNQAGGDTATIGIVGGQNVMGIRQLGSGTGANSLMASLTGNLNNWSGGFSGEAAGIGLTPGSIYQNNNGTAGTNSIGLTVNGNLNKFAFKQIGSDNTATGTMSGGNSNQAAVAQNGTSNTATFTQTGGGNNVGITQ